MKRRIAATICAVLWGIFFGVDIVVWTHATRMHASSYPSASQLGVYVGFPAVMVFFNVYLAIFANVMSGPSWQLLWWIQMLVLVFFPVMFGGGV
jgi:hypothetical protein